jgi:hypothetical protein
VRRPVASRPCGFTQHPTRAPLRLHLIVSMAFNLATSMAFAVAVTRSVPGSAPAMRTFTCYEHRTYYVLTTTGYAEVTS